MGDDAQSGVRPRENRGGYIKKLRGEARGIYFVEQQYMFQAVRTELKQLSNAVSLFFS